MVSKVDGGVGLRVSKEKREEISLGFTKSEVHYIQVGKKDYMKVRMWGKKRHNKKREVCLVSG